MPKRSDSEYKVTGRGTNEQGNNWDHRDYGDSAHNKNSYHYSNKDDSFYYSNPGGSKYHNDGKGNVKYTDPSGGQHKQGSDGKWTSK